MRQRTAEQQASFIQLSIIKYSNASECESYSLVFATESGLTETGSRREEERRAGGTFSCTFHLKT